MDLSLGSLKVARGRDATGEDSLWRAADAYRLPWRDGTFDAVAALDFLEHVDRPGDVIAEAARVLKPGGLFFFHTFNRNLLAWLVVIKGLEWFVRNTPERMHVLPLFIKPEGTGRVLPARRHAAVEWTGMRPEPGRRAFWKMLLTGRVPEDFAFRFTPSLAHLLPGDGRQGLKPDRLEAHPPQRVDVLDQFVIAGNLGDGLQDRVVGQHAHLGIEEIIAAHGVAELAVIGGPFAGAGLEVRVQAFELAAPARWRARGSSPRARLPCRRRRRRGRSRR